MLKLNTAKTEIMSIVKLNLNMVKLNELNVNTVKSIKFLGLILDNKLKFKDHLEHLKIKIEKLILKINKICWFNNKIQLKDNLRIYKNVFLPIISYGSKIQFKLIREKSTYTNILIKLQRLIVRSITNSYKNTNSEKLLEIKNLIEIIDELDIKTETDLIKEKDLRIKLKREHYLNKREKIFDMMNLDFGLLKYKESIWCLTESGPFKNYLFKMNLVDDDLCRFCSYSRETAQHLIYECIYFNEHINFRERDSIKNIEKFELIINIVIKELRKCKL